GFTSPFGGTVETGWTCSGRNGVGKDLSCANVVCPVAAITVSTAAPIITSFNKKPKRDGRCRESNGSWVEVIRSPCTGSYIRFHALEEYGGGGGGLWIFKKTAQSH